MDGEKTQTERTKSAVRGLIEWIVILAAAVVAATLVKTFLIQAFLIPSESMTDTLNIGDRVLVNKLSYRRNEINHGDIVVMKRSEEQHRSTDIAPIEGKNVKHLIKRVIAVAGDSIESKEGKVFVNGEAIKEPYVAPGTITDNLPFTKVPSNSVFVMGDNRGNSHDSRAFGAVTEDRVVGRAFVLLWPPGEFELL